MDRHRTPTRKVHEVTIKRTQAQTASLRLTHDHIIPQYGQRVTSVRGRVKHTFPDGSILLHTPVYGDLQGLHSVHERQV